jgi:Acetyltransferase (isoleucine patch superfamily)
MCFDSITIGDRVAITWDCQIMDTSFHYIEDVEFHSINPLTKKIVIGSYVWVGNRTTISKGSIIPDQSIVASNSLVNKDFSREGQFCMFAGMPAKVVKRNVKRIWNEQEESILDKQFCYNRTHL